MGYIKRAKQQFDNNGVYGLFKNTGIYFGRKARQTVNKNILHYKYGGPIDIMEKDWDNLIILDACRWDIFKEVNHIEGDLSRVVSAASKSNYFMIENFHNRKLFDTIYITGNPHADRTLDDDIFHKVIRTYANSNWENRETYHPKNITDTTIDNYMNYFDKRIIVHYMQPHTPYLGDLATKKRQELLHSDGVYINEGVYSEDAEENNNIKKEYDNLLVAAKHGYVSDDYLARMYKENLKIVLKEVERLIREIDGKTVITSDHGELLGNPTAVLPPSIRYEHPSRTYVPELRVVPWLSIMSNERREITSDPPESDDEIPEEMIEKQLRALGYKE